VTADGPLSTAHLPRPDPARGVFETLLVVDGSPVELDAHLDRLAASVRELFGAPTMARVAGPARLLAEARAHELPLGRLRVTLAPDGQGRLDLTAVTADVDPITVFPSAGHVPELAPVTVAGGLGGHKWADRRLLDQAAATLDGALPLLVDADGTALETERASLFLVRDDTLTTPSADGRILPGIARARVIAIARELGIDVSERSIQLTELESADEVFLTGSVRGVEPVRTGPIAARLSGELRRRWRA